MWAALGWKKLDLQCPLLAITSDGISLYPPPPHADRSHPTQWVRSPQVSPRKRMQRKLLWWRRGLERRINCSLIEKIEF